MLEVIPMRLLLPGPACFDQRNGPQPDDFWLDSLRKFPLAANLQSNTRRKFSAGIKKPCIEMGNEVGQTLVRRFR